MLAQLLQRAGGAGQNQPGGDSASATDGASTAAPASPPPGGGLQAFASKTLASLLSLQEDPGTDAASTTDSTSTTAGASDSRATKFAEALIKSADTDGDGSLSAAELQAALGGSSTTDVSTELSKLDTDGDGKLSASELASALQTQQSQHSGHAHHAHRGHHGPPSADDVASKLLGAADSDGDGALSLDEVERALDDSDSADAGSVQDGFKKLDTDGDGKLSSSELSAALTAFRQAHVQHAPGQQTQGQAANVSA
jgi:Ca2+-binding EF-hand superfamily protein